MENNKSCCFMGDDRGDENLFDFAKRTSPTLEELIVKENVNVFYFTNSNPFINGCNFAVGLLKKNFPHIQNIYVEMIENNCDINAEYLLEFLSEYDDIHIFKTNADNEKLAFIHNVRSYIQTSDICIFQKSALKPTKENKGLTVTQLAYKYAKQENKTIIEL